MRSVIKPGPMMCWPIQSDCYRRFHFKWVNSIILYNVLHVFNVGRLSNNVSLLSPGGGGQYLSPRLKCVGAEEHPGPDPLLLPLPYEPGKEGCVTEVWLIPQACVLTAAWKWCVCVCLTVRIKPKYLNWLMLIYQLVWVFVLPCVCLFLSLVHACVIMMRPRWWLMLAAC